MRKLLIFVAVGALGGCFPFAGSIDGERFACESDDDCAGDSFVCVAGICRDPRDLRLADAGAGDAQPTDARSDAATPDTGSADHAGLDASPGDSASPDSAPPDAAPADTTAVDSASGDASAPTDATEPDDAAREDATTAGDTGLPDSAVSDSAVAGDAAIDPDAAPAEDAAGGEDAAEPDAGVDAGPCLLQSDCPAVDGGEAICFSGRCGHFEFEAMTAAPEEARAPSLAFDSSSRPAVAYYDYTSSSGNRSVGYVAWGGSDWVDYPLVDLTDDVGAEPQLAFSPADLPWCVHRNDTDDVLRISSYNGVIFEPETVRPMGTAVQHRGGFAIDPVTGTQHLLALDGTEGLLYGRRTPSLPAATPTEPFSWRIADTRTNARWPRLFVHPDGQIYGVHTDSSRPFIGIVDAELGYLSAPIAPDTNVGCGQLGLPSNTYCDANEPVDLAWDSRGRPQLCTVMTTGSSQRLMLLAGDGEAFDGLILSSNVRPDGYDPGARCALVVDALDVAHVFAHRTDSGRQFEHWVVWRDDAGDLQSRAATLQDGDLGHWPTVQRDRFGTPHLVFVESTARSSSYYDSADLLYGRWMWDE